MNFSRPVAFWIAVLAAVAVVLLREILLPFVAGSLQSPPPYRARAGNCRYARRLVPLIRVPRRAFGNACGPSPLETGTVSRSEFWLHIAWLSEATRSTIGISIESLSLAIPVKFGFLPCLRVRTAQVFPEASIAGHGLPMAMTPIEGFGGSDATTQRELKRAFYGLTLFRCKFVNASSLKSPRRP
jgi:hypothetical protein